MTEKPKAKPREKKQSKRFIEKACEIEADESGEAFERGFAKAVRPKLPKAKNAREDNY